MEPIITRLAPTPSGFLHQGNAFNFLYAWLTARSQDGKVFLRIDDLDATRSREEFVEDIFQSLQWLGLDWDLGPSGSQDFYKNWSQQTRMEQYEKLLNQLVAQGNVFACNCSRKKLSDKGFSEFYPGYCIDKKLPLNIPDTALRIKVPPETIVRFTDEIVGEQSFQLGKNSGSFIIRRRDGIPAYHIASLADDIHFGVNLIVRGEDLLSSTASQLYLAQLTRNNTFPNTRFHHHPLILDKTQHKLSKSKSADSLLWKRENGMKPVQLLQEFATWCGIKFPAEIHHINDLLAVWNERKN